MKRIVEYGNYTNKIYCDENGLIDISSSKTNDIQYLSRVLNIALEEVKCYSNWYCYQDKLYYYKHQYIKNELIASLAGVQFDLQIPKFLVVKNNNELGIMSENFQKKNINYIYGYSIKSELPFTQNIKNNIKLIEERFLAADNFKTQIYGLDCI